MDSRSKNKENERNYIRAIERAVSVLECISDNGNDVSLTTISEQTLLAKSTVFNILYTLESLGYIKQKSERGKYSLDIKLFELGQTVQRSMDIITVARPYMELLVEKYNETIFLGCLQDDQVFYLDKATGSHSIGMMADVGWRGPAYCTGLGKVLLSDKSDQEIEQYFRRTSLIPMTDNTIVDRKEFLEAIKVIRERQVARDNEEIETGLTCVSVPIYNHTGRMEAAISISGPTVRLKDIGMNEIEKTMKNLSRELSRKMGYNPMSL